MYINPFLAGVLATIGIELMFVVTASILSTLNDYDDDENDIANEKDRQTPD